MIGVVPSVVMLLLIATTVAQSQNTSNNNDSVILPTSNSTSSNGERQPQPCGDAACMHGGTCTTVSGIAGDEPLCDCSAATFTHNHTTHSYAGRYCEHAATVVCTSNDATNGHEFFCTNGGTCKGGTTLGCDCPVGFMGPVCEFKNEDLKYTECMLECQNDGICRKGAEDVSFLTKFGLDRSLDQSTTLSLGYNQDFEHCVCPRGYAGLQCEYKMEICPGREYVCMHGGECKILMNNGNVDIRCDCEDAETGKSRFTGNFCEVPSTAFCTESGHKTSDGPGYDAFCTQGGTCKSLVADGKAHPGCNCIKGTWGEHCEFGQPQLSRIAAKAIAVPAGITFGVLALFTMCFLIYEHKRQQRRLALMQSFGKTNPEGFKDSAFGETPDDLDFVDIFEPWKQPKENTLEMTEPEPSEDNSLSSSSESETKSTIIQILDDIEGSVTENNGEIDHINSQERSRGPASLLKPFDTASTGTHSSGSEYSFHVFS